jgi:outer membrane protein, heavy metal efflux system
MSVRRLLALSGLLLLGGCLYHVREQADEVVCTLAAQPYDLLPSAPAESKTGGSTSAPTPAKKAEAAMAPALDLQTTSYMQAPSTLPQLPASKPKIMPQVPPELPGAEATPIPRPPKEPKERQRWVEQLYPELPPLPAEPTPLPGPEGRPYTLADLQQIAAVNSPELRQAASDVKAAQGALIQARAYPNPTIGWNVQPSNDGETASLQGPFFDQKIIFAGKLKHAQAAAEMDLRNAELALRRARSDLATRVRNAYFALLVAKETVRVNKALARYTDEIYRLQSGLFQGGIGAPYEPMALRAIAYTTRLTYIQAIPSYIYAWKQLVAAIGLRQLPLTEVAGRIDAVIPYFDYDAVRDYVMRNHSDVLTARNGIDKARYNVKLAQITPYPDVDFNVAFLKEYALAPKQFVHTATIGFPFPIWDQNKGNIMSAEAALMRAGEEPHRVEESLTTTLATAYTGYKNNLAALEYYRRHILPDQVRAYRGALDRRQIDKDMAFGDLLAAQQALVADVTAYLAILGPLWTSVVSVADLLQTDDLFQMGQPLPVPALPDLETLPSWPCCHECPPLGVDPRGGCRSCPFASAVGRISNPSYPSAAGLPAPPSDGERLPPPLTPGAPANKEQILEVPSGNVQRQDKTPQPAEARSP